MHLIELRAKLQLTATLAAELDFWMLKKFGRLLEWILKVDYGQESRCEAKKRPKLTFKFKLKQHIVYNYTSSYLGSRYRRNRE